MERNLKSQDSYYQRAYQVAEREVDEGTYFEQIRGGEEMEVEKSSRKNSRSLL